MTGSSSGKCHGLLRIGNHREAVQHRSPGSRSGPGVVSDTHPNGQRRSGFCVRDLQDITLPRSGRVELSGSGRVLGKTTKDADWQVFAPSPGLRARLSQRESEVKNPLRRCPTGCNRQAWDCATPMGLGFLATDDPGCAARPGALVLDPFGDHQQIEKTDLEFT